jgi:peptidyl-prolyl cis-trans isomerase D
MFKHMRKKGLMKVILWILAGSIILAFGVLGEAYLLNDAGTKNYAGKIFGKKISRENFAQNYRMTEITFTLQYGQDFAKIRDFLNLPGQTWDRIILLHEANRQKIQATDEEVINLIQSYNFFQRDGRFDRSLYEDVCRYIFKIQPRDYEEGLRDNIKIKKLYEQITDKISIPEEELFESYKQQNEKVQISYVLFGQELFMDQVGIDEKLIKEFYEHDPESFKLPPMIRVSFIRIPFPSRQTAVADESLADSESGTTPSSAENVESSKKETLAKAESILSELQTSADFAAVAQKHGLMVEDSGYFSMEHPNLTFGWPYPLIQQLFTLEVKELTEVVETIDGYQILQITDKRDASIPSYEEAKADVTQAWTQQEAKKLAQKAAEENFVLLKERIVQQKLPDFSQIAKELNLNIFQTPLFTRGEYLPKIGPSPAFQEAAFSLSKDNPLSAVVEMERGYGILHLDERTSVKKEDYEKDKAELQKSLLEDRRNEIFSEYLADTRLRANLEDELAKQQ